MLSDDASCEGRKKVVKILRIITYDNLPPPPLWVDVGMILGGGLCFGAAVETAARTMEKFDDSEFEMAVDEINGKQTTINSLAH
jgi:hypothetical protein